MTVTAAPLPTNWVLAASAFNWTPDVLAADRTALDIAAGIAPLCPVIEVEAGQLWRSFPDPLPVESTTIAAAVEAAGARVSIIGASIDDWASPQRRRTEDARLAFLLPQLRAAHAVGADGIRLPLGQAGPELTERLLPYLYKHDLTLFEEAQGPQTPAAQPDAYQAVVERDDPHVRLLIDTSMLMPLLPVSYLERLAAGGVPHSLLDALRDDWRSADTEAAVRTALRDDAVPPATHTLFMNLLVRFGRARAADLRDVLPFVSAVHLKLWDLDDSNERITAPLREFSAELANAGFRGTLCSEWGGHEWLDAPSPTTVTAAHLDLARRALATGLSTST